MVEKQDRVSPRTPADIERKHDFNKSFAEVMGVATEAKKTAEKSAQEVANLTLAEYDAYIPPTYDDAIYMTYHLVYPAEYPVPSGANFDLNGDGVVDDDDAILALKVANGEVSMEDCAGAEQRKVTVSINTRTPGKVIHIYGTNQFGSVVETAIGIDSNTKIADRVVEQREENGWTYRKWASGMAECFGEIHITVPAGESYAVSELKGLPINFTYRQNAYFTCSVGAWNVKKVYDYSSAMGDRLNSFYAYMYCDTPQDADVEYWFDVHIIGEWKLKEG